MKAALALALLATNAIAGTVTIQGPFTFVICDGFTPTHYKDNVLVITCPAPSKFRLSITDCEHPKLTTLSPGNFSLTC